MSSQKSTLVVREIDPLYLDKIRSNLFIIGVDIHPERAMHVKPEKVVIIPLSEFEHLMGEADSLAHHSKLHDEKVVHAKRGNPREKRL